ncbi:MAG TPA: formate dehydrogenase accessory protein FdhE [Dehalococcoidia bacterium]|nr:formate dehydrogenase accessory protein FdhE [Dehalococcoidia bacterium]
MSSETEVKMLQKLDELEQRDGKLPGFIQLYRQLLRLQSEVGSQLTTLELNLGEDVVSDRLSQGVPLLSFEDLLLDGAQVQALLQEIIRSVAKDTPDASKEVESLGNILSDKAALEEVVRAWYEGSSLISIATRHSVDGELLSLVVAAVVKPFLSAHSEVLLPKVNQESWRRRYCPICGGRPDFAYLDEERGARWLLCSRCDAEWLFQRLECPCCGCQDQNALAYFTDDEGLYRLYVCAQCKRYLKAIDLRQAKPEVLLPLERLLTFEFDIQAQEEGYRSCAEADIDERKEEGLS